MADANPQPIDYLAPFAWPEHTPAGWRAVFRRWDPHIAAVIKNFRLPKADADEITQQVRINVFNAYLDKKTFDTNARFAGFVRTTTRGKCLNWIRDRDRRREIPLPLDVPQCSTNWTFKALFPEGLQESELVDSLLSKADEADRPLLQMRWIEVLTFEQMGKRLGCAASVAHRKYTLALQRLRRGLINDPQ